MSVKKHTKKSFPVHFEDNGNQMLDKQKIADTFNNYFTNIAQTIVNDIKYKGTKDFSYYLNRQIHSTYKINNVAEEAVKIIIHNLPTKHSCGFDGISFVQIN
jgi:metal-dependent amidase/aminoacylase/carboxypeptidase family protein